MNNNLQSSAWRSWVPAAVIIFIVTIWLVQGMELMHMRADEQLSFTNTLPDFFTSMNDLATKNNQSPLWWVGFWAWWRIAGDSEFAARYLSVLYTVISLGLIYRIGLRWFGAPRYGWFALMALGSSAYFFVYALELRPYALVMLVASLSMLLYHNWLLSPTSRRAVCYGASVALMVHVHYYLFFLILAQALYLFILFRPTRQHIRSGLLAVAVGALLWLPWLPGFISQMQHLSAVSSSQGASGLAIPTDPSDWRTIRELALLATNGLVGLVGVLLLVDAHTLWRRPGWRLALAWGVLAPALLLLLNLRFSLFTQRYVAYMMPGLAIALGAAIGTYPRWARWPAAIGFVALSLWNFSAYLPTNHTPYKHLFRDLSAAALPDDPIYYDGLRYEGDFMQRQMRYYMAPELIDNAISYDEAQTTRRLWHITDDFFQPDVEGRLQALLATHAVMEVIGECRDWCFIIQRLEAPPSQEAVTFGDQMGFLGADLSRTEGQIDARLWWQVEAVPGADYSIGLHLLDSDGQIVAQNDGAIQDYFRGETQTSQLQPDGGAIIDMRSLTLADLAPGDYALELVVYQWWDGVRLTLPDGEESLTLDVITVE